MLWSRFSFEISVNSSLTPVSRVRMDSPSYPEDIVFTPSFAPSRRTRASLLLLGVSGVVAIGRSGAGSGPFARCFLVRFVWELRSVAPISAQLWREMRPFGIPIYNRKLGHSVVSYGSHTRRENFAKGPRLVTIWLLVQSAAHRISL